MKDQVVFFDALLGTCRGTEIFPRLCRNSWGRTVLHLFLLSVFCAFAVTLVQAVRTGPEINRFATGFFDAFGNLKFNAYGLKPEIQPDKARTYAISGGRWVSYFPSTPDGVVIPEKELLLTTVGVVWTPKQLIVLTPLGEDSWQCSVFPIGSLFPSGRNCSTAELKSFLAGLRDVPDKIPFMPETTAVWTKHYVMTNICAVMAVMLLLFHFLTAFILPFFYTGMFALVFRFTGGRQLRSMTLGTFWKIGIYAGFPVMLFASCFPAFDLPFLRYGTVYMIGLVIYWLVAAGRIERAGMESGGRRFDE